MPYLFRPAVPDCGLFDFLMVKVIHYHRRSVKRGSYAVVVFKIGKPLAFCKLGYKPVKGLPVAHVPKAVYTVVERDERGAFFPDVG